MLNLGYVRVHSDDVVVTAWYTTTGSPRAAQTLRNNGARCLEITNPSNRTGTARLVKADGTFHTIRLQPGTTGLTLAELKALGWNTRGDMGLESPVLDPVARK